MVVFLNYIAYLVEQKNILGILQEINHHLLCINSYTNYLLEKLIIQKKLNYK